MSSPPIKEEDYIYGVKVVQIEDLRLARGMTKRPKSSCKHLDLVYDEKERRVWCKDCESDVEPFDALVIIANHIDAENKRIENRLEKVKEAEASTLRSRAAKVMDDAWRKRNMVPCCPHCRKGIFPEDIIGGVALVGKDYAKHLAAKGGEQ